MTAEKFMDSVSILDKLLYNILSDPSNSKFRTIRITNPVVNEKIWRRPSTVDILKLVKKNNIIIFFRWILFMMEMNI